MSKIRVFCLSAMLYAVSPVAYPQDFMSMGDAVFSAASAMQMNSAIHCQTTDCPSEQKHEPGDFASQLPRPSVEQVRALVITNRQRAITARVEAELYERIEATNPKAAQAFQAAVQRYDMIQAFDDLVRPYGLASNRLNEALTAYWVMGWTVIHQADIPPPPPVKAVNKQTYKLVAHNPTVTQASTDARQHAADGLIYQFMFLHAAYTSAQKANDSAALQDLAEKTQKALVASGIDLTQFELDEDIGFKPKNLENAE